MRGAESPVTYSLVALLAFLGSCAPTQLVTEGQSQSGNTLEQRQLNSPEKAMDRFGLANRSCLAWANWQQTCSRKSFGSNALLCNAATVRAERSEPFCYVREKGPVYIPEPGAAASFDRYCTSFRQVDGKKVCLDRAQSRPFGGTRIAEMRTPYCEIWGNEDGKYCTENQADTKLPKCAEMLDQPPAKSPLSCFKQSDRELLTGRCGSLGNVNSSLHPKFAEGAEIAMSLSDRSVSPAVNPYCSARF
jgi:hypothetical protein